MTTNHDCRQRQPEHDRIASEIDAWLRDSSHKIELVPIGVTTGTRLDSNNRFFQEREDGVE